MDWKIYFVQGMELLFLGVGTYYDIKDQELSLHFLITFFLIALSSNMILKYQSLSDLLIGGCIGSIFLVVGWMTKEEIGYGDGIGLMILGILTGWKNLMPIIFAAFLLSGIYGLWKVIGLKVSANSTIPFFPFLLIAAVGVILI